MKVCLVRASGKLGQYLVRHALDHGDEVVVGRVPRAERREARRVRGAHQACSGATDDRAVIERAVAGCDGVLTVLVPWGVQRYSTGTAQAVLALMAV